MKPLMREAIAPVALLVAGATTVDHRFLSCAARLVFLLNESTFHSLHTQGSWRRCDVIEEAPLAMA